MPLTRITIEEVGSSAPVDKRWLCEMEVGNAGTFRTVHVQKASLSEILKEIDRQYTGKSTMELLAELPTKRKPGRQPGWRKPVKVVDPDSPEARGIQPSKPGDDDYVVPDHDDVGDSYDVKSRFA